MVQASGLKKIIIIGGPTASGKTALSLRCAEKFNGEIIGCDSMQIYRGLNIGTGKISQEERGDIPHFMIDIIPPNAEFSVNNYANMCDDIISDISSRGKLPIVAGGTGLYANGLLYGLDYAGAAKSEEIRNKYAKILEDNGKEYLFEILRDVDCESSLKININDTKRVIRALEIYELTGSPKSKAASGSVNARYDYLFIVLSPPRHVLYDNIDSRVDEMIANGLLDEVKSLYSFKECQSMQAIGYKEIIAYLDGRATFEEAVEQIKINSRHYAKRQLTYFKHMKANICFYDNYDKSMDDLISEECAKFLNN